MYIWEPTHAPVPRVEEQDKLQELIVYVYNVDALEETQAIPLAKGTGLNK